MATKLGYWNLTDIATLSAGSWSVSYPLTNLQNRYLREKARSTNALTTSTFIDITFPVSVTIGLVALVSHNLSSSATVRVAAYTSSGRSTFLYDDGVKNIYSGSDYAVSFANVQSQWWRIYIADTTNALGYVEFGRLFMGPTLLSAENINYGASMTVETDTQVVKTLGGPEFFDSGPRRLVWRGKLSWLTDSEAYGTYLYHMRRGVMDTSHEVYLIEDDTDTTNNRSVRNFYGRFRVLPAFEWPYLDRHEAAFEVAELL